MNSKSPYNVAGLVAVAGCAFLWSIAGILIKLIDWNPFAIAAGRSFVAGIFILVWLKKPHFTFSFPQLAAAVCSALTMLLFIYANKTTSSANAILLQYGAPIYTAFFGFIFLKEKVRPEHWIALVCIAFGMVLFFKDDISGGNLAGNIAAVASGITFAFYFVFMRMQKDGSPLESGLLAHIFTMIIAAAIACFLPTPQITVRSAGVILVLGVVQIGLATVLLSYGIKRITALQGILVAGIEPVCNPFWVFLATGELPGPASIAGGLIILLSVTASSAVSARRAARG